MPAFHVTPRAAEEVARIAAREGKPSHGLRVTVSAGGCSGLQYGFELDDSVTEDDLVIEQQGSRVLVDSTSLEFVDGAQLDWHDSLMGSHFVVKNPQAVSGCGCGTSFAVA